MRIKFKKIIILFICACTKFNYKESKKLTYRCFYLYHSILTAPTAENALKKYIHCYYGILQGVHEPKNNV